MLEMCAAPSTCLITGGTSGIGRAAALVLADRGWDLLILGRHAGRGRGLCQRLQKAHPEGRFEFIECDLANLSSVRAAAASVRAHTPKLDSLVNNAGARFDTHQESPDGIERTFASNHLGHFLLTALLWPLLTAAPLARVVTVSSGAHRGARPENGWRPPPERFDRRQAYACSKLANLLFAQELARRTAGVPVVSIAFDPGVVATRFALNNGLWPWLRHMLSHGLRGQLTPVRLAGHHLSDLAQHAAPDLNGRLVRGNQPIDPGPSALTPGIAENLWDISLECCGLQAGPAGARWL
jgi:NAD(P)-dependent dehydrogenase (short-subunit alcohol dehydrogenase family)